MRKTTKATYRIFWRHLRPYRRFFWLAIAMAVIGTLIDVATPLFYKRFFDILASGGPIGAASGALLVIILEVLGLHTISWLTSRVSFFVVIFLELRVMNDLTNTAFQYLHGHSYGFFINRFAGALVRKVNRLASAFEGVGDKLYWDLLPLVLRTTLILAILFAKNTLLGAVMAVWAAAFMAINYALTMYKLNYDIQAAESDTKTTAHLADTVTNQANIKLFTRFQEELNSFRKVTEDNFQKHWKAWKLGGTIEAVQAALTTLLEFGIFYIAIQLWTRGALTVGDFVLLQAYVLQMVWRLWDFGRIFRQLYRNLADAEEMIEILETPHEIQNRPGAPALKIRQGEVAFENVRFSYHKGRDVIRDFNLTIRSGEKVGFVGPSGAGKTTLSALLLRFFNLPNGKILIDGQNIADVTQESLRANVALVPQEPILFHRTLMENIRYGREGATDAEVMASAELAHCSEFIERLPDKYHTLVGERGIKLSGGERQRVAIARAILKSAPILVLDEATSSLDSHSEALIQDALGKLMRGKTTIVIAHRLSTIMRMDRIVVMRRGEIKEVGSHDRLIQNPQSLYKKLWELQVGGFIK
ncbi:MAG: ABC transporter ATP-binding protein [Candidatus Sungbacteria bacterium]|uniref:ABC transporter ATP-binding protein n=1 Tax=Candidatus Sungiibacteriota bacterium TaxID=2750080 RepID=A0A931WNU2_9BACT|nr:ABC transporter ATP-binding protein [Candidatus Sungbacteria bacterium]